MDYPTSSNDPPDYEGFRNPSPRSSTGPVIVGPRYPASHGTEIDSLRPTSTICYESPTKYLPSRSYPSANGFNTNISSNPNASSIEMGDYTNAPTFLEEPDGNICFEPEAIDAYYTASGVTDFNQLLPEWPPLNNSVHATSSAHDNYSTNFAAWPASEVPWHGTSAECSVREASNSQPRYQGAIMDNNKIDGQKQAQRNPRQAQDDPTLRCQETGCGKSFSRTGDLKRHLRELHDPGQKRFLCGCCTTKPDGFKREDKLINHKVKFHEFRRGSRLTTCPECFEANTLDILYFCSDDALEGHRKLAHEIRSIDNVPTGRNDIQSGTIKATRMQSLSDENKSDTTLPESSSKCAKRGHQIEIENTAKRAKLDVEVHENKDQGMETVSNNSVVEEIDSSIDLVKLGNETESVTTEEILVPDVGISDFFALSKNKVIRAIEENMKPDRVGGLAKPEISFNAFQGSIRLRGFGNITRALKAIVDELLGRRQRLGSSLNGLTSLNLLYMRSGLPRAPPPQPETRTKIFAMRHTEDAELLKVWHERIIPSLPDLLAQTIGDNYSASLVRKGISELSGTAVIQIQSHTVPSKTVRALIRSQIVRWVAKDISLRSNQVQFLKGRLTTLAGELHRIHEMGDSPEQSDPGSNDAEPECYPFFKRYWRTPGPGASIGLLCTKSIAATIACYVHVDGRLFILTVKHFITKSYDRLLTGTSDRKTVVSPALADVDDMRERFRQDVTNFNIELDEAMRDHFGDEYSEYVPLGDIGSLPDRVQDIMVKLDVVRKDLSHLTGGDQPFRLGSLAYQSTAPSNSDRPLLSCPEQRYGHHMDWALCSVLPQRAGANRHRYQYDHEERAVDFYAGDTDTFGAGQPFLETCVVEANTKVHFVGQATGRQSGEINAARILIRQNGIVSEEWAMVMSANGQDGDDTIHRGDSGASIVRDSDNKLAGLLWACTKDGQLVLTPINIVFDDIRQKVPAVEVSLPPIDRGEAREIPLTAAVHEVDTICRDKTIERPKLRRQFRSSDMPSPRRKQVLASSIPDGFPAGNSQPPVRKTVSLPIPLLGSPRPPIFNPPNTTFGPVFPDPAFIRMAQQVFRALEDNKNKHSLGFILTGYPTNKLEKRSTFPQTQNRALRRTGTWPARSHLRLYSRNAGAFNAISVN